MDLYFTEEGDLTISPSGDLAVTQTTWRDDLQQAYIRCMTDVGDWRLHSTLGASLSRLWGMPQSPQTGDLGSRLIEAALDREGRFAGKPYTVKAVPVGPQSIRWDISITSGSRDQVTLSVEQDLGGS